MFKVLQILSRNKLFYVFAFLIVIMFPSALYMQSDKDRTIVVTTIGIDKKEDEYTLSALAVIPKGSNDINANLEVFEADGDSVSDALDKIAINTGKKIGLAHCDCIIFSKDITEDNVTLILDYFIRTANLTTNAALVVAEGKSKDLIEATKSSNNLLDLSLKNIVMYQEERTLLEEITIEKFYRNYFTESSTFYLPILDTEKPEEEAKTTSSSGSAGNEPEGGDQGGDSSSSQSQTKIKNEGKILILKQGKKVRELTEDEMFIYNLLSPTSIYDRVVVEGINDQYVTNSTEIYQQVDKFVLPIYTFEDGKPVITYNIWQSLMVDEIIGEENFHYASMDSLQNYLSDIVQDKIKALVQERLDKTTTLMKQDNVDILDIYDKFNAFHHGKWKKYLSTLENQEEYLQNVEMRINLYLNYVI